MNLHELIREIEEHFDCHPGPPLAYFSVNNPGRFFQVPVGRYAYSTIRAAAQEDGGEHRLCAWLLFSLVALPKRDDGRCHTLIWRLPEKAHLRIVARTDSPAANQMEIYTRVVIPGVDLSKLAVPEGTDGPFLGPVT